jgi:hypothetical protein
MKLATSERGPRAVPRQGLARRGGRYPEWAPAVAVGAARRLRCGARGTRAAAMPLASGAERAAASWLLAGPSPDGAGLPLVPLRSSPRHKSPTPDTAHRAETLVVRIDENLGGAGKAAVGCASAATLCGAEHRRARGRARAARASTSDSRRLFEHSERSERREFRRGPCDRGAEGIRSEAEDAVHERRRIPGRGFASLGLCMRARVVWNTSSS